MAILDTSPVPDHQHMPRLDGRGFVVIGGGQGIGRQAAHGLAQFGAKVTVVGRSAELTQAVAREVDGSACLADATKRSDMERVLAKAAASMGGVHGIVDSLGMVQRRKPLHGKRYERLRHRPHAAGRPRLSIEGADAGYRLVPMT